jgi:hypothetical protein
MTEVNGLRLAYRGLVTGLAAGYVWAAVAMLGAALSGERAWLPLDLLGGGGAPREIALGIAVAELASGGVGIFFAYFFGRFFTVRLTVAFAAPCFAFLAWLLTALLLAPHVGVAAQLALALASVAYGIVLGAGLPLRPEVVRYPPAESVGSPVT